MVVEGAGVSRCRPAAESAAALRMLLLPERSEQSACEDKSDAPDTTRPKSARDRQCSMLVLKLGPRQRMQSPEETKTEENWKHDEAWGGKGKRI
jgi:hypothetical protein